MCIQYNDKIHLCPPDILGWLQFVALRDLMCMEYKDYSFVRISVMDKLTSDMFVAIIAGMSIE